MPKHARPVIVISRCIDFDACRYDGQVIRASLREELEPHVRFEPICPELEIGLGVPRDPIRIVERDGRRTLIQPSTQRDFTTDVRDFADRFLASLTAVDGFILKSRSPSCAVRDARLHDDPSTESSHGTGPGMFAERVREHFPLAAIEDEAHLAGDFDARHLFLTRLFALAAARAGIAAPPPSSPYPAELARRPAGV